MSNDHSGPGAKQDKRHVILQAAWSLIKHYGYNKTTIDDIAKNAGVGKGTVYLYFRSKTEIMLSLADLTNERITAELERIATGNGAPKDRLRRCLLYRVMTLYELVTRDPHSEDVIASMMPEIVKRLDRYIVRHGKLLQQILEEGCACDDFEVDEPKAKGQLLAHLFEFLTPPYYRFQSKKSLERFAHQVVDLLLIGLCKHQSKGGGCSC